MEENTTFVIKYDDKRRMTDFKEIPYSSLEIAEHILQGYEPLPEKYASRLRTMIKEARE